MTLTNLLIFAAGAFIGHLAYQDGHRRGYRQGQADEHRRNLANWSSLGHKVHLFMNEREQ